MSETAGRAVVAARSAGRCELCGSTDTLEWSHRRARGQGGSWDPANGVRLCHRCHAWAEAEPTFADAGGWRIVGRDDPPERVPVWLSGAYGTGWWYLDNDGCLAYADPETLGLPTRPDVPPWVPKGRIT